MADDNLSPICQDTGMPTFKIENPCRVNQLQVKEAIIRRLKKQQSTTGKLCPNSRPDSPTGEKEQNSGDNLRGSTRV